MRKGKTWKRIVTGVLSLTLAAAPLTAHAEELDGQAAEETAAASEAAGDKADAPAKEKVARTVMLYATGADLESRDEACTWNLHQILNADFDEDVHFIVMTGGALQWHMESESLYDPATGTSPAEISSEYNQIWEAKGAHAKENPGKMVLLDKDGLSGDGENAKASKDELMNDPATLKAFINYSVENFPAEQYDLILWDHGGGPSGGFGYDFHQSSQLNKLTPMSFAGLIDAFSDNAVTRDGGKFDFIDFDACLMSSADLCLAFADYTNYYIASPETEPGYGQDYTGWLNMLGENPRTDTYQLGKKIVDDLIHFYDSEDSAGYGQPGTLAVVDIQKLLESGFVSALTEFDDILHQQILEPNEKGEYSFYDEFFAFDSVIHYSDKRECYFDLGNLAKMMNGNIITILDGQKDTAYTKVAGRLLDILENQEIMYARGTKDFSTEDSNIYKSGDTLEYSTFSTSGMYLPVVNPDDLYNVVSYVSAIKQVIADMPDNETRHFLKKHMETVADYALVVEMGKIVSQLSDMGIPKEEITYDRVKAALTDDTEGNDLGNAFIWLQIQTLFDMRQGGEEAARTWLDAIVRQQAKEALSLENIDVKLANSKNNYRYIVNITDTPKRTIDKVVLTYTMELPAVKEYWNTSPYQQGGSDAIVLGYREAELYFDLPADAANMYEGMLQWYGDTNSRFEIDSIPNKWFAVRDVNGTLHVAEIKNGANPDEISMVAMLKNAEGESQAVILRFQDGKPAYIAIYSTDYSSRREFPVSELTEDLELMPAHYTVSNDGTTLLVPISQSPFVLSAKNADQIELLYTDIAEISDIADIDGDEHIVTESLVITDMYSYDFDVSNKVYDPTGTLVSIADAEVQPATYDGTVKKPVVTLDGKVLKEGEDYTVVARDGDQSFTEVGKYGIVLYGKGEYGASKITEFEILPPDYATPEGFANMAKVDYEKKHGVAVTPEVTRNEDGTVTVTLKDADGKTLDTYTMDVKTGIGTDTKGAEVNLPQTGVTSWNTAMAAGSAFALTAAGFWMICRASRKKREA